MGKVSPFSIIELWGGSSLEKYHTQFSVLVRVIRVQPYTLNPTGLLAWFRIQCLRIRTWGLRFEVWIPYLGAPSMACTLPILTWKPVEAPVKTSSHLSGALLGFHDGFRCIDVSCLKAAGGLVKLQDLEFYSSGLGCSQQGGLGRR